MYNTPIKQLVAVLLLILCGALSTQAAAWNWTLPGPEYQGLTVFERAQYDKAARMMNNRDYASAAKEFEKLKIQFPQTSIFSYVVFMRAYALHQNKERNQAIELYNEVLDFFGGDIDIASAALYHLGMAHIENGDEQRGMEAMKEMADDPDYRLHPLAAGAIRRLGNNYWKNRQPEAAVRYWKQVADDFRGENDAEANAARNSVIGYYVRAANLASLLNWMLPGEDATDAHKRRWAAEQIWQNSWLGLAHNHWGAVEGFGPEDRDPAAKAFMVYFLDQKSAYAEVDRLWEFYMRAVQFSSRYRDMQDILTKQLEETLAFVQKNTDEASRNNQYAWLVDRLREGGKLLEAEMVIQRINDPALAAYKSYELTGHSKGDWKAAEDILLNIIEMGDEDWQSRAENQLAFVYQHRLGDFEKAIQMYRQIANPPATLWEIQECQYRMGDREAAIRTLSELQSMFPDYASRAAWQKAWYYHQAGESKEAIAQSRNVLKAYPKSKEASQAHQLLEKYGVETGGGVIE